MKWVHLVLAVMLAVGATAADPPSTKEPLPTTKEEFAKLAEKTQSPPWLPDHRGGVKVFRTMVKATVVKVTDDSITVLPDGKEKAVTYPAHELLKSGAVCHWESDRNCYLLNDVRREDVVYLAVGAIDKTKGEECFFICLYWRPGGEIPPSRKPDKDCPWHKEQQERVNYEVRGEYTPEEIHNYVEKTKFLVQRGYPPPPPLPEKKPLVKAKLPLDEKDDKK